jgi:RNA polymerase sigma-70 factor (ECF subfamily)
MAQPFRDDAELIERCIQKDLAAWSIFIKRYSPLVSASIANRLKKHGIQSSSADIDDIRQNTLTAIWQENKLATIKNRGNVAYWLAIVSGNEAIEYARRRRFKEPRPTISLSEKMDEKELSDVIASAAPGPRDEIARDELAKRIEAAIGSLPDKERLVIKLNLLHDKKYGQIAAILNMPAGTVSNYIKRAKEKLKAALKDLK